MPVSGLCNFVRYMGDYSTNLITNNFNNMDFEMKRDLIAVILKSDK